MDKLRERLRLRNKDMVVIEKREIKIDKERWLGKNEEGT